MPARYEFYGAGDEGGSATLLARVTALQGTGQVVRDHEGRCLLPGDVAAITVKIFDIGVNRSAPTGVEVASYSLAPNEVLSDTLSTSCWPANDPWGWNFRAAINQSYFNVGGHWYRVEVRFELTGGEVTWLIAKMRARAIMSV